MKQCCLCEYKKLYFQDKILCLSSNQDLILFEDDSNFQRATSKIPYFKSLLTRKQARWPHFFLLHFLNGHIMNVNYAKFQINKW